MYYIENGLRKVRPYFFEFKTHAKSRWVGRSLLDVFMNELGQEHDIVKKEIIDNLIYVKDNFGRKEESRTIKGWSPLKDRVIEKHDIIYNVKHMHEPSIPYADFSNIEGDTTQQQTNIEIVFKSKDILVVNKPIGIPTHPTGTYRFNSLTEILKYDLKLDNIWPCHRLDQTTSGILILALHKEKCNDIVTLIDGHKDKTSKSYIARVKGFFPDGEITYNCPIFSINTTGGYISQTNYENLPRNSPTMFRRLRYNEKLNQSIVLCQPITGRMHQIRIHLRNMGFPIINDKYYNPLDDNSLESLINKKRSQLELDLYKRIFLKEPEFNSFHKGLSNKFEEDECVNIYELACLKDDIEVKQSLQEIRKLRQMAISQSKANFNKKCQDCNRELFDTDRDISKMDIWLHSFKYQFLSEDENKRFSYETKLPVWANI